MPSLADLHAGEAHESQGQQTGGDEADREALEALRIVGKLELLAHACEQADGEHEAETAEHTVDHALHKAEGVLRVEQHDAEHGAVGGDQGEPENDENSNSREDAPKPSKRRRVTRTTVGSYFPWWGWLLIAGGVLAVGAVVVILIVVLRKKRQNKPQA